MKERENSKNPETPQKIFPIREEVVVCRKSKIVPLEPSWSEFPKKCTRSQEF
jgi:hypothetical protein